MDGHEERTFGERLADAVADAGGSWSFLIIQTILVVLWIAINVVAYTAAPIVASPAGAVATSATPSTMEAKNA